MDRQRAKGYRFFEATENTEAEILISSLFQDGDIILFKTAPEAKYAQTTYTAKTEFIMANPVKDRLAAKAVITNLKRLSNIVVEFDDEGLTRSKQIELVEKAGLPYTTATFSGNKSVHFIVSIFPGFRSLESYAHFANAIYYVLGGAPDPKCKNPNRLTRLPGVVRASHGKTQALLKTITRERPLTEADLLEWLTLTGPLTIRRKYAKFLDEQDLLSRRREAQAKQVEKDGPRPIPKIYSDMIESGTTHPDATSRHDSLVKLGAWLTHNGYDEEDIFSDLMEQAASSLGIGMRGDVEALIKYFLGKHS